MIYSRLMNSSRFSSTLAKARPTRRPSQTRFVLFKLASQFVGSFSSSDRWCFQIRKQARFFLQLRATRQDKQECVRQSLLIVARRFPLKFAPRVPGPRRKTGGSLSRFSACSGVFDCSRRVQLRLVSGRSNVMN